MQPELIAPCGVNCRICVGHFGYTMSGNKRKMTCPGCIQANKKCAFLKKHCDLLAQGKVRFCFECGTFPCEQLIKLDKRYREKYAMSSINNLKFIQAHGMNKFLQRQTETYTCPECGKFTCVHTNLCYTCSPPTPKKPKK
jgi:hypothetical protein